MLKKLQKLPVLVLLTVMSANQMVHARANLYKSNGQMPFVRMMLAMMDAMGMVDRLPARGLYGQSGYNSYPWLGNNNPYSRSLALQGLSPGYGANPFLSTPWSQSPWTQSAFSGVSPVWGSPDWGVLPEDSYTYYDYSPYGTVWSPVDLRGWVDEPWEVSKWNPKAETHQQHEIAMQQQTQQQIQQQPQQQAAQPVAPIVQNFNVNVPESLPQENNGQNNSMNNGMAGGLNTSQYRRSPLAKLPQQQPFQQSYQQPQPQHPGWQSGQNPALQMQQQSKRSQQQTRPRQPEKPCVTEFCGLKKPNLNGLWVAQDGEMLGINKDRYLWTDGVSRYLTGDLKIQNEYLLANVDEHDKLMRFKYKYAGNHLLTMQPDGQIREFIRMPANQYLRRQQGYSQEYGNY